VLSLKCAVVAAGCLVVLGGTAGCAAVKVPGGAQCAVSAQNPHRSSGTPTDIVGKARYGCDTSIDSNTNIVVIQQQIGGRWVNVTSEAAGTATTYRPSANVKYTNQASLRCRGGVFRTASRGYGYYRGVRSQSTAWDYSQVVTNPCG
jgi:hypothetical protein